MLLLSLGGLLGGCPLLRRSPLLGGLLGRGLLGRGLLRRRALLGCLLGRCLLGCCLLGRGLLRCGLLRCCLRRAPAVECVLECCSRREAHALRGRDLHRCARLRIASDASSTRRWHEVPKAED